MADRYNKGRKVKTFEAGEKVSVRIPRIDRTSSDLTTSSLHHSAGERKSPMFVPPKVGNYIIYTYICSKLHIVLLLPASVVCICLH